MRKKAIFLIFTFFAFLSAMAQQYEVKGVVYDAKTNGAVELAAAVLLNPDSTVAVGNSTNEQGLFHLKARKAGKYILKVSFMGYQTHYSNLQLTASKPSLNVGDIRLETNDRLLGEAVVQTTVAKVEQKEDTTVFNAAAYRVPEGSTLEALVKQLPGVEIADDGSISWNGKKVKELLVNGKDFFKGDKDVAMKNLPTEMVSRIKAYDKQSDYTEMTGVDDGEEATVLDITTKRELNRSLVSNVDLAYGTEDRYSGRVFISSFSDRSRVTAYGSLNNVNSRGFGGPRGWGGGGGLTARKNAGLDFSWENGRKKKEGGRLELGGSVNYSYTGTDVVTSSSSETFLTGNSKSSFSNSFSRSGSSSQNVNTNLRLEWNPDSMTSIRFRPSYSHSSSKNDGNSLTATFNKDPYAINGMYNPLDSIFKDDANDELEAITVNRNSRQSLGDSKSDNVNGDLNIVRRLNSEGRNVSLRLSGGYGKSENNSFTVSNITYYNGDAPKYLNQYSKTPSENWNYSVRAGYVEPFFKNWFAELRYGYNFRYTDNNRSRYNLDEILDDPKYSWNDPLNHPLIGTLPSKDELLNASRDLFNSQYATYKYMNHTANLGVRYKSETIRFNVGVDLNPQKTKMAYERPGQHIDTLITRDVFNVSPQVRFRYRFSKTQNLDIRYNGSASQPSMTDLLDVVDNSNPLSVSMGNPGLKPSWTNRFQAFYHGYNPELQQGIGGGIFFNQTNNSVSNLMVYDEATGVRYMRPENINGNWDASTMFMFNTGLGKDKNYTISSFTNLSYRNSVGYVSSFNSDQKPAQQHIGRASSSDYTEIFNKAEVEKNTNKNFGLREHLRAGYRNDWLDLGVFGRLNYDHSRSELQDNGNMDTWNFSYGGNVNINFNWGMSLSTDIGMSSRRGYSDASMNTNELLWNAQLSQSFLRDKSATISLQFYDILQRQSNVSRTINAMMRSDSWNNSINSYCMVHFIYKLNIFNGSKAGKGNTDRRPGGPMHGGHGSPHRMM